MPRINCELVKCIHNENRRCDVADDGMIDVVVKDDVAVCVDYAPITDEEYEFITGEERKQ